MGTRKPHPDKDVEAAIRSAEDAGWKYVAPGKSSHAYGQIRCPHRDRGCRNGQFCSNSIWRTPRNSKALADKIHRWVSKCTHANSENPDG